MDCAVGLVHRIQITAINQAKVTSSRAYGACQVRSGPLKPSSDTGNPCPSVRRSSPSLSTTSSYIQLNDSSSKMCGSEDGLADSRIQMHTSACDL